jgi:MSHA biogenesis protein MshJ
MSAATYIDSVASRVNGMNLRERALVFAAALGLVALVWDRALMQPLERREHAAQSVLESLAQPANQATSDGTAALDAAAQRLNEALQREQTVRTRLGSVNNELEAAAAQLLPPERVVAVVRDVLAEQHGLALVSLRNLAPLPLVPADNPATAPTGPFLHPVEVVVAGDYLGILDYLRALERSPWRFYWRALDLKVDKFPRNIVRLEIATLGTDQQWLGVGTTVKTGAP